MIKVTAVQKQEVLDCGGIVESNFVYQMNKSYTLESVKKLDESDNQTL